MYIAIDLPARMNEKVTQVPATAFTMMLSDILVFESISS